MDKKAILGWVLIGLITVGYIYYSSHTQRLAAQAAAAAAAAKRSQEEAKPPSEAPPELIPVAVSGGEVEPAPQPQPAPAATPPVAQGAWPAMREEGRLFRVHPAGGVFDELVFDSVGACLRSVRLSGYFTDYKHSERLEAVSDFAEEASFAMKDVRGKEGLPLGMVNYDLASQDAGHIEFQRAFAGGLVVVKRFEFLAGAHHVMLTVSLENGSGAEMSVQYELSGAARVPAESQDASYLTAIAARRVEGRPRIDGDDRVTPGEVQKKGGVFVRDNAMGMPIIWVGSTNKYFAALLKPLGDSAGTVRSAQFRLVAGAEKNGAKSGAAFDNVSASLVTNEIKLTPGAPAARQSYLLYIGPKSSQLFEGTKEYADFAPIVNYGWFDFVAVSLLWMLRAFYRVLPNYGVAIILLTIAVRAALHPLTKKAQISMFRMQKLAPEIKKLQEKYKNDKQRLGREQMDLFKREGVNPMGGCLPLLLQFPILIGLYRALEMSVDLRDAPFVLWVHDLSLPDTVTHLGSFPLNILPIAMIVSWIVQQKLMPKSPDPQARRQQWMMTAMTTVMFGFIFYSVASGLTLYWLTSTVLGIVEQRFIQHSMRRMDAAKEART